MDIDALVSAVEKKPEAEMVTPKMMDEVEAELVAFDRWFQSPLSQGGCGEGPLVKSEKALLRTYLVARRTGRFPSTLPPEGTSQAGEEASRLGSPTSPSPE